MLIAYYIFIAVILMVQAFVMLEAHRNLIFTIRKYRPKRSPYRPPLALITPCKGLDTTFDRNIAALFEQNYDDYEIIFVVEGAADPAHDRLREIIATQETGKPPARILIAGIAEQCAQKVHNLLYAVEHGLSADREVLAFVDSDACPGPMFLQSLVHPLRKEYVGVSTGHRWFVPLDNRLATIVLSAMNAFFASLLGPHEWNAAWGGAMAVRRSVFEAAGVPRYWRKAGTDDYTLTKAVREQQLSIEFVPACFVASYEKTTWLALFAFARRQFLITRVNMPSLWRLALMGVGHYLAGFWVSLILAVVLAAQGAPQWRYPALAAVILWLLGVIKATMRQVLIRRILPADRHRLLFPGLVDMLATPLLHVFTAVCLAASAFGRQVCWRGVRYRFIAPDHTEVQREDNGC